MSPKQLIGIIVGSILTIVALVSASAIFETNMAGYMHVKQAAITGTLSCQLEPGMYGQWFGDISEYAEAETFYFTSDKETDEDRDQSLGTMFNDGSPSRVSGSLRVLLPRNCEQLQGLHRKFHGMDGVMVKLVLPAVRKALFNTGPHMTAGESYAERRGEFAMLAEDQLKNGIIMVTKREEQRPDPITGEQKTFILLEKRGCTAAEQTDAEHCIGGYYRDRSAFSEFGVDVTNFVIDNIHYPDTVLEQIETQRKARMNIITVQAQAKEADARASKAGAEAKAQIEETRAKEEVKKTEIVVAAEAERDRAKLRLETAELNKQAEIATGQGEAERRKLVMSADGALEQKLKAWLEAQKAYADALARAQPGALVPTVIMGQNGSGGGPSASDWITLLTANAARDLALDVKPGNTKP